MSLAEDIAGQMLLSAIQTDVQVDQTRFRMKLVAGWPIAKGSKVLEVGCGQGDMTAVLADAVGAEGHVTAVDRAHPDYGAPVTLGESADRLKTSPLGGRIDFRFECDVLDSSNDFSADSFDVAVLSHCSWYFASADQLGAVLRRVQPWAKRLCFAEWDMEPNSIDQVGHFLAVVIQGQFEAFKAESSVNVRTPLSRTKLKALLHQAGWKVVAESVLDSSALQDGGWEIEGCLESVENDGEDLEMPTKLQAFLASQIDVLKTISTRQGNRSLPTYSIVAERV